MQHFGASDHSWAFNSFNRGIGIKPAAIRSEDFANRNIAPGSCRTKYHAARDENPGLYPNG